SRSPARRTTCRCRGSEASKLLDAQHVRRAAHVERNAGSDHHALTRLCDLAADQVLTSRREHFPIAHLLRAHHGLDTPCERELPPRLHLIGNAEDRNGRTVARYEP